MFRFIPKHFLGCSGLSSTCKFTISKINCFTELNPVFIFISSQKRWKGGTKGRLLASSSSKQSTRQAGGILGKINSLLHLQDAGLQQFGLTVYETTRAHQTKKVVDEQMIKSGHTHRFLHLFLLTAN